MKWISFIVFALMVGVPVGAETDQEDRFWILWEKYHLVGPHCPTGKECKKIRHFSSRLFEPSNHADIFRLFGMLDGSALAKGQDVQHAEAPRICQHQDPEVLLGFDPEAMPLSDRIDALKGLEGIYFDVSRLKAPANFSGDFGSDLQQAFIEKFNQAGIRILEEDDISHTKGQPKLAVYFSKANANTGCTYSVFASLSQTALLTRDLTTKLRVGVWSHSARATAEFPDLNEYDAILSVADALVRDFQIAND